MQDACHMNFVIDLAHYGVSVVTTSERGIRRSEGPKVRSLINFSLYYARDKTKKNIFLNIDNRI